MRRKIIPYEPHLKGIARKLRKEMTLAEIRLWNELKTGQMLGYDFDRQKPLDKYIVDFYCKDLMLAIEVDGASHDFENSDVERQDRLESYGVRILRFSDKEILKEMPTVLNLIYNCVEEMQK